MPVLSMIDTLGIQQFVFASNRLKDVDGGSWLVERASGAEGWIRECLERDTRVLIGSGGNLLLNSSTPDAARDTVARLTRRLADKAPGLEVAVTHETYLDGQLASTLARIQKQIEREKLRRKPSLPLLGLSVTAVCRETGLPAVARDEDGQPISATVDARRASADARRARWQGMLPQGAWHEGRAWRPDFPKELDDLGRSHGDTSLMAVVHVDGNGIGKRISEWLHERIDAGATDEDVEEAYILLSSALDDLVGSAFRAVVQRTCAAVLWNGDEARYEVRTRAPERRIPLKHERLASPESADARVYLPIRPILLGGDDLTFVCDARLGLDLATTAIAAMTTAVANLGTVTACAGIAMVKTHAPFSRAYAMAESLCRAAKKKARTHPSPTGALDWHVGYSSPSESLDELRGRQYAGLPGGGSLTCRPYLIGNAAQAGTWEWMTSTVLSDSHGGLFASDGQGAWMQHRNKLKELRTILRDGAGAVRSAMNAWRVAQPALALPAGLDGGFLGHDTPLLDALELIDIYTSLEPQP